MSTYNNLMALHQAREAFRKSLDALRPELGPLGDDAILKLANQVAVDAVNGVTPPKVLGPGVAQAKPRGKPGPKPKKVTEALSAETAASGDILAKVNIPDPARKLASFLRKKFQGESFAMADIAKLMNTTSRAIVPYMVALEKNRLVRKVAKGKRNDQAVNIYRLGQALTVPTEVTLPDEATETASAQV